MMMTGRQAAVMGLVATMLVASLASQTQIASGGDSGPQPNTEVPFRTIDKDFWSYVHYDDYTYHGEERVIRDNATWESFWNEHKSGHTPMPPPPTNISWGEEMVLVAIQGIVNNCCQSYVKFTGMDREGDVLHAYLWTSWKPGMLMALTNPYHIVAVESVPTVIFEGGHGNDIYAPEGSIVINDGDLATETRNVTLMPSYSDIGSGVFKVRYSNDRTWDSEPWESPSPTKAWTLTAGDGLKTVYYQVIDRGGLLSPTYSDSIWLAENGPYVIGYEPSGMVECTNCTGAIVLEFSTEMDPSSTSESILVTMDGASVAGTVTWSPDMKTATFTPLGGLQTGRSYHVVVGPSAKDSRGRSLGAPLEFTFMLQQTGEGNASGAADDHGILLIGVLALAAAAIIMVLAVLYRRFLRKPRVGT